MTNDNELPGLEWVHSRLLTLGIDAGRGGRIVSLIDRVTGREWLVQPKSTGEDVGYGASFTRRHIYGWDEMLPTIDACSLGGVDIPDHGEVWAVPWFRRRPRHANGLHLAVDTTTMQLTLSREAWPLGDTIVLDYELHNRGDHPQPFLWAAHPQFQVGRHAEVSLFTDPVGCNVVSPRGASGPRAWRDVLDEAGRLNKGSHLKVWMEGPAHGGAVTVQDAGSMLRMQWQGQHLRHLAILWDNGEFSSQRVLAIEPANAGHDALSAAIDADDVVTLPAGESLRWSIELSASGEHLSGTAGLPTPTVPATY
ncbi:hypothetical protein [Pseudarthrobacter sp. SSS035]|uniref:hypothetical protein n=1 Tax=Pseudarthrobacter sp. SSS035 TaxID=2931399 RepID=UPI00200FB497|nr:hypothetical protein [Pseudarthrobacter sp. SSS035]